ncbi:FAD-dependent oxidoreductase [Legionella worsleiensis]|uniref:2-polyprenyl-6-methoxyphenol hydroxylase n=1 Tax=Legionella worsleiensis TaxID=45076 RepID=A0A0W1AJW9_9GAMM|nr:FAD-dependent oxidoreductase [Legionella worsleiensis]KTD81574.1 2-polyprenyl-6-methoxyphenol hydroxylase [Legionella worsleiensis]STY32134.1 2-polyprenyl-6-methoxyphenol hydroxylase [Legionella worsleiensis]
MSHRFDVLVVGGGIVGLTAAIAMAQRNYSVAVIDAGSLTVDTSITDRRVYAINKASQSLFKQLGVWDLLDASRVSPYHHMHVWDAQTGAHIDFDSRLIAEQRLGSIIEESILKQGLLLRALDHKNISLFAHCSVDEVENSERSINIRSEQQVWEGQLLMIADGAHSPTRNALKIELTSWSYHQNALVATVRTEKPHLKTAFQVFNPDGPLAFLPLVDSHHCSIVWSSDSERAQALMALTESDFNAELTRAFANELGQVELISPRHQFPLQMRHVKHYTGTRWLLLGDAAHTIHPLAGLGLNLGLADIASWLKLNEQIQHTLVSKKMLGAYQRERKHAVWQTIMLMEGFKHLFSQTDKPITLLRGLGLRMCNELNPIKRLFVAHAAG